MPGDILTILTSVLQAAQKTVYDQKLTFFFGSLFVDQADSVLDALKSAVCYLHSFGNSLKHWLEHWTTVGPVEVS